MKKLSTILVMTVLMFMSSAQDICAQTKSVLDSINELMKASPPPTGMIVINVECKEDGKVSLTNRGNADVKNGTRVRWNITCDIVDRIVVYPDSKGHEDHTNIWASGPEPQGDKSWAGITRLLDDNDPNYILGYYTVIWYEKNNTPHVIDPLIKVNK